MPETDIDVMDLLGIEEVVETKKETNSFGRINITLFRKGAWIKNKTTGEKVPYPDAGNYDRMIADAGCGDNPTLLIQVVEKLLNMVATGKLVKK